MNLVEILRRLLRTKPKLLAVDVDGTLTINRHTFTLHLEAVEALRRVEKLGVKVSLITGNSIPVVAGLARYIGVNGPCVAENGCVVFYDEEVIHICKETARDVAMVLARVFNLKPSWQNPYRYHDYALVKPGVNPQSLKELARKAEKLLMELGIPMKVAVSGYAIHIQPPEASKASGLLKVCELLNVDRSEVIAVGDSVTDLDMFRVAGLSVAVSNADPELKLHADIVLSEPSGRGLVSFINALIQLLQ